MAVTAKNANEIGFIGKVVWRQSFLVDGELEEPH